MKPLPLLSEPANIKLGGLIHSWAISVQKTCPGSSRLCRKMCYGKRGHLILPNQQERHRQNWEFSQTDLFVDWMASSLLTRFVRVMRIHVVGDFYDVPYTRKWQTIVSRCPDIQFYAYTRSWRVEEILVELIRLSQMPNFIMWWSMDRETGPAPAIRGIRRCYMAINDVDASNAPNDCDLVFRDVANKTVLTQANGVRVCPHESNAHHPRITCSACKTCWNGKIPVKWEKHFKPSEDAELELVAPECVLS